MNWFSAILNKKALLIVSLCFALYFLFSNDQTYWFISAIVAFSIGIVFGPIIIAGLSVSFAHSNKPDSRKKTLNPLETGDGKHQTAD